MFHKGMSFLQKKVLFSSSFIVIVVIFIALFSKIALESRTSALPLDDFALNSTFDSDRLSIELFEDVTYEAYSYSFANGTREVAEKLQATDYIHTADVLHNDEKIGELTITARQIDNGDLFVFSNFTNTSDQAYTIPLKLTYKDQTAYDIFEYQQDIPQEHDNVFGIDYTTNVKGIFSFNKSEKEMMLSQNYISKQLIEKYGNGEQSVLRELVNEDLHMEATSGQDTVFDLKLRTTAGGQISENWFVIGNDALFSSDEEMAYYKNYTNHYFIRSQKWLVHGGNYSKLPWSVEPSTTLGYGRNLVQLQGKLFIDHYKKTKDRFYYNMLIDNVNNLLDFKGNQELWQTEYTSTWLKREYGITAPYTDTRHNENIALFLERAGEVLQNDDLASSYKRYANFLVSQQDIGNILPTENGYYVLDYYSPAQTKKTHVSLNHALGEMNFLFNAYQLSKNEDYLNTALQIKAAVEDIGTDWINPYTGDLWYQINEDYSFEGTDYEFLTLDDLMNALHYYEALNLPVPTLYGELINSKVNFIRDNNIPIDTILYEKLMASPYAAKIDGYEHVYTHDSDEAVN